MLAKKFRLPTTVRFQNARVIHSTLFTVRYISNNLPNNRYGFIAGKKIDKRAVVRNRIKRRARSVVEKENSTNQGYDVLLLLKPSIKEIPFEVISQEIRSILQKLS